MLQQLALKGYHEGRGRRKDVLLYIRDAHGITDDSITDLECLQIIPVVQLKMELLEHLLQALRS